MRIKERLLPLARVQSDKVLTRVFAPHAEKLQPHFFSRYDSHRRAPIHLALITGLGVAWNKRARNCNTEPHLGKSHIALYSGFTPFKTLLIHQPVVYPMRRMSLLCRLLLVTFEPLVDNRQIIPQRRERLMIQLLVSPWLTAYY
ncbi:hypothetical protein [Desulfoferrobacter suflitae]|uniref:hypothetical protein n=1 Tax=Desulfoferrobacter suflitae TaxID=2865782 RepID=UPI002164A680|nr:hypothetical protein [Desulfoferrobacter suflitae]MCK8604306.1 hypothetical protein [Desulfoferrobacter suflitae]